MALFLMWRDVERRQGRAVLGNPRTPWAVRCISGEWLQCSHVGGAGGRQPTPACDSRGMPHAAVFSLRSARDATSAEMKGVADPPFEIEHQ